MYNLFHQRVNVCRHDPVEIEIGRIEKEYEMCSFYVYNLQVDNMIGLMYVHLMKYRWRGERKN